MKVILKLTGCAISAAGLAATLLWTNPLMPGEYRAARLVLIVSALALLIKIIHIVATNNKLSASSGAGNILLLLCSVSIFFFIIEDLFLLSVINNAGQRIGCSVY